MYCHDTAAGLNKTAEMGVLLNQRHLPTIYRQLKTKCSTKWKEIGTYLGFCEGELDIIVSKQLQNSEGIDGCLRIMLAEWMEWSPGDSRGSKQEPNLGALKCAICAAGCAKTAKNLKLCEN